ncbi:calmodulin-like protein [Thelephora terrestris]|uniref:Calmodulin-like protein n=1 Tax=Thelephora terrestris TaxID=56493 RepID=A0A9P6LD91_9AGAM|nr:calmodulin-like protein [Thelephora terrestris]
MQRKSTLNEGQVAVLKEAFEMFDEDGNGTITPAELGKLMKGVLGSEIPKGEIEAIIKSVDADNSGTIDFDEFLTLMSDPKFHDPTRDESREVFEMFDKDGSGNISVSELKEAFRNLGEKLSDDQLDAILREADLDGDGLIDYEEFLSMLK